MNRYLVIVYLVCLFLGLLPSGWLLFRDVRTPRSWLRNVFVFFTATQIALVVLDLVTLLILLGPGKLDWVDVAIACTLQSTICTNLARLLRVLCFPVWSMLLPYVALIIMDVVVVIFYLLKLQTIVLYPVLIFILITGPGLSACCSYRRIRQHRNSGQRPLSQTYLRLLGLFVAANAVAALSLLCGGLLIFLLHIQDTRLHQGINLACVSIQLVCTSSFCSGAITTRILEPVRELLRPDTSNTKWIEMVEQGPPPLE